MGVDRGHLWAWSEDIYALEAREFMDVEGGILGAWIENLYGRLRIFREM